MAEDDNLVKAQVPEGVMGKKLYDADGNCYVLSSKETSGLLGKKNIITMQQTDVGGEGFNALLKKVAKDVIRTWLDREAVPYVKYTALGGEELFARCVLDGERKFRKEFIEKLGECGAKIWRNILTKQTRQIVRNLTDINVSAKAKIKTDYIWSSGIMPPGCRFKWMTTRGANVYTMFCIESPPCIRNIKIFKQIKRLAFPYLVFMPLFVDNQFSRFYCFYGKEEITSEKAEIFVPNLPHVHLTYPYDWCIGGGYDTYPDLSIPGWHTLVQGMFWDSAFVYDRPGQFNEAWMDAIGRIPEVSSVAAWEKLTQKSPERMLKLPWSKAGHNLGEFARKHLEDIAGRDPDPMDYTAKEKLFNEKLESLLGSFQDQLQEELHFLGSTFVIQPSVKVPAENFAKDSMSKAGEALSESLCNRSAEIVDGTLAELKKKE